MEALWVTVGIIILALTLFDVFLTALNYDEAGFFAGKLAAWQWIFLRSITRRLSRRWRPVALRQVTGLQIMVTVFAWIGGVIVGYGLIYYGMMHGKNFLFDGVASGLFAAMYFSAAQLATVGTSQLSPNTDVLRVLSILETITGVILVSLILTFLLGVYQVISDLRSLSSKFSGANPGAAAVAETLAPFFPDGNASGLDGHLQGISDALGSYTDGLRLHHAAYYFQSGREQFSLPFSMRMLGGTIGALRWGLPSGHPSSKEPMLTQLGNQFDEFKEYLHPLIGWQSTDVPEIAEYAEFARTMEGGGSRKNPGSATPTRLWLLEFKWLNHDMAKLTKSAEPMDLADAYHRYRQWLPFAYNARQATRAVSADLDYQPIIALPARTATDTDPEDQRPILPVVPDPKPEGTDTWWQRFWRRRVILIDPGMTRFLTALRAVTAALATAATLFVVFAAMGVNSTSAAIFGAVMAMSTSPTFGGKPRVAGLAAMVPIIIATVLSSIIPHSTVWTMAAMVILAMVAVGAGSFGKAIGGLGQLLFIAFYFTLLMHLRPADLPLYVCGAVVGVLWAFVLNFVIAPETVQHMLKGGVIAFEQRLAMTLDPVIDAVSWARWDPDINKRVRTDLRQLMRSAAFLSGQLKEGNPESTLDDDQAGALRQRIFDAELAMVNLVSTARNVTGTAMPVVVRAALSGQLLRLQQHLTGYQGDPRWVSGDDSPPPEDRTNAVDLVPPHLVPADWPAAARRVFMACDEMVSSIDALHEAQLADLAHPAEEEGPDDDQENSSAGGRPARAGTVQAGGYGRRAIQSGLTTGVALAIGSIISPSYQYWAALPAYQVLGESDGETFIKGAQRIIGTVAGAAVGFAVAINAQGNPLIIFPALTLCIFANVYFSSTSAPLKSFWQTMMFAQLYEILGKLSPETVEIRVLETIVGAVVALLVAALVLPTRTRTKLSAEVAVMARASEGIVRGELARLDGTATAGAQSLDARMAKLIQQLRRVNATAAPLRRNSGSMESGGIEAQLTAVWSLVYYTRHLMIAVDAAMIGPGRLPELDEAGARLADNFAALQSLLQGGHAGEVHVDLDLPVVDFGVDGPLAKALKYLDRIHQTVLVLIVNMSADETLPGPRKQEDLVG